jgi:hypothetical protein
MAQKTIGDLVAASSVALADRVAIWNGSTTLRATLTQLQALIGGAAGLPVADSTAIVKGSVDGTKQLRFEVDGFDPGTTHIITAARTNIDLTPGTGTYLGASMPPWSSWTSKDAAAGNVTVNDTDPVIVGIINHTVARTVTFPSAPSRARAWYVTNHGTATLTLQPAAIPLVRGHSIWLAWSGAAWGWSAAGSNQGYVGDLQAALDINGQIARGNLAATGTVAGAMTAAGHSGRVLNTTADVTVPATRGFNVTLIAGGAHTVTYGATVSPAMAAGDIMSILVDDGPAIHASLLPATGKVAFA